MGSDDRAVRRRPLVDRLPVDPDVLSSERLAGRHGLAAQVGEVLRTRADLLALVAVGGAIGALSRYGVEELLPAEDGEVPWGTFVVNITGCLAIGLLMVVLVARRPDSRHLRPLLGVGLLGGYTTWSTYAVESRGLLASGHPVVALAYLAGSVVCGLLAVSAGLALGRAVTR